VCRFYDTERREKRERLELYTEEHRGNFDALLP
jgi:hypothetical protein